VTRWRVRAIISGAASIAVTVAAQPARCRVHIPVPQAISQRVAARAQPPEEGGDPSVGAVDVLVGGHLILGGPGALVGDLLLPRHACNPWQDGTDLSWARGRATASNHVTVAPWHAQMHAIASSLATMRSRAPVEPLAAYLAARIRRCRFI
jgi:hypothetical protein